MASMTVDVHVNTDGLEDMFENLLNDEQTMLAVHTLFAKTIDPWVPYLNGPLSETVQIEPNLIRYVQPYARYQYYGVGFNHTKDFHPLASAMWDKAAMEVKLDEFRAGVRDILVRRAKELYG